MYIDTHCHLQFSPLAEHVDEILRRAKSAGVTRFIVPGTNAETSQLAVNLAEKYEEVYAAVGVHPEDIAENYKSQITNHKRITNNKLQIELKRIESFLSHPKVVAVGEVGLDNYMSFSRKRESSSGSLEFRPASGTQSEDDKRLKLQKEILAKQIQLAIQYKKALILHSRETVEEIIEVLSENWNEDLTNRTVLHCCEASDILLTFAKKHGVYIGIDGDISWSKKKQCFIKEVPLSMIVLETDSPYLVPLELKEIEKLNEPKNVVTVAEWVAKVKEISVDEVEKVTSENAERLFFGNL